jgi:alpha-D-xyloside xylohydrolase
MELISLTKMHDAVEMLTTAGKLRVQVVAEKILHVQYTLADDFSTQPSLLVLPQARQDIPWSAVEEENQVVLRTESLCLSIDRRTCAFTWTDSAGNLLAREPEKDGKVLREITLPDRQAFSTRLSLVLAEGEAIYGLGQHEEGVFNYRGYSELVYHHNLKVAMPVFVSTRGYAFFFDSCSLGNFHDDQYGTYYWCDVEDEMDFYFSMARNSTRSSLECAG